MDEHSNDSNNGPGIISPDNKGEDSETTSAPETTSTDNTSENPTDTSESSETSAAEDTRSGDSSGTDSSSSESLGSTPDSTDPAPVAGGADTSSGSTPVESSSASSTAPTTTVTPTTPTTSTSAVDAAPAAPSVPADDTPTPSSASVTTPSQPSGKKPKTVMMVVLIVVVIAIIAIVAALVMGGKKNTPTTTVKTTASSSAVKVDTWTGKASTDNWDTAGNWSLGIPTTGEDVVFNASTIKTTGSTAPNLDDNISGLSIAKLTVDGTGVGLSISGDPLTITGGIAQDITQAKGHSGQSAVELENSVTFKGDGMVSVTGDNQLVFASPSGSLSTMTVGASTVQFSAAKSSDIEVSTPVVGTGEIEVPSSTTTTGNVDFNTASPDFSGNVMVSSGATIGMGNQNATGTGVNTTDAFGTATITVASGGYLELNEVGSSSFTIPNNITVGGNGATSPSQDNGADTGAISACITSAQEGCGDGATVTLTGKVTLTSDTEFGAFYGIDSAQVPPSTTATYVVKNLATNSHTLTAVPSSKAVIQDSTTSSSTTTTTSTKS